MLAGCGTNATIQAVSSNANATTLTVYSDLPVLGADGATMQAIVNGEALALYDAGGRVRFRVRGKPAELHIGLESLNDAGRRAWTQSATAASARSATADQSGVAYIGDFDSGATWHSLPLANENDMLQISPASPYLGFTNGGPGVPTNEPAFFYPFGGRHTFVRLVPSYREEALATVAYMRALGVRRVYLLSDDADGLNGEIAPLMVVAARAAGIAVVGRRQVAGGSGATPAGSDPRRFAGLARAVRASGAGAVLYGGTPNVTAAALWRELHALAPAAKLFAPSTLALPSFLARLGPAAAATYVTSPYLEPRQYPAAGRHVLAEYRRRFPGQVPSVYALYGYEAMRIVLAAVQRAGSGAPSRAKLLRAFFSLGEIHGVIGDYRFDRAGNTSLHAFDGYRVGAGGRLVFVRALS